MQTQLSQTMYSFYDHNSPLVYLGGLALICLILAISRGSRFYIIMFVAFFILTFKFEYDKHLFSKIKTDMLDLIFPEGVRFRKYTFVRTFLEVYFPMVMDVVGWGMLALNLIFNSPSKDKKH
jgi:hypothetical protein